MRLPALLAFALLASCSSVRTDVDEVLPDTTALIGDAFVNAEPGADAPLAHWWERFEDPALDELVQVVLAQNFDLREAAARVREADARARAARGVRGPELDGALAASRNVENLPAGRFYSTVLRPQLTVAWQADLFGRLRANERGRLAEVLASEADRAALVHSLVAQAVRFRIEISLRERELAVANEIVESRSRTLDTVEGRYERGVRTTSAVDVHQARENLAAALASLPAIRRERKQAYLRLDALLGRKPGSGPALEGIAAPLPGVPPPPVGVPGALLDQRPDVVAARMRVEASAADVDVSLATLYPDLSLSGTLGWSDEDLGDLFTSDTLFASLAANLAGPIFSSGRLRADVDAARARLEQLAAAYATVVLGAAREVEDAIVAERGLQAELAERVRQRDEALLAEELARDRYRRGLESLLTVLDTERRRANSEEQVLFLQAAVWNARVDLHLALGGNWFAPNAEGTETI